MKRANIISINLFLLLLLFSLIVPIKPLLSQENNDYKWLHPKPVGNELRWIKMWDANNWYAAGGGLTFMKTTNAGATWDTKNNYFMSDYETLVFTDMEFLNMNTGYACGSQGKFYKTTNAGDTWDSMTVGSTSDYWLDMYWVDQMTGVMCGFKPAVVVLTTDGGATWTRPGTPANYTAYSVYAFSKDSILLSCEQGRVLRTTNGGANWSSILGAVAGIYLNSINFINNSTGYICGSSKNVRMTTNFGSNWTLLNTGIPNTSYYDIDFRTISDSTYIYITGSPRDIYRSKIGTDNWVALSIEDTSQQYNAYMTSSDLSVTGDTIITCGEKGFINARYSSSNIKGFTHYVSTIRKSDIWSDGNGRIIAVGNEDNNNDQSMYSTDGGNTWQQGNVTGSQEDFFSISMVNSTTGYASSRGAVYETTTGGAEWIETTVSTDVELYDVCFVNVNTGYTVGEDGDCYKTTNGGTNWTAFDWGGTGTDNALSCSFINANTGWIGGYGGQLFKTTNGGATTFAQVSSEYDIMKMDMIDANTGWLASQIYAMKTTNGGTTWDTLQFPFPDVYIEDIDFADGMNGVVLDYEGTIYKTTDGGNTWDVGNPSSYLVERIYMVSPTEVYVTGGNSQIFGYKEIVSGTELTYNNSVPTDHFLEQNYPNPFNPSTTIKFGIPKQGLVSLKVYDMSGREVSNLINNQQMNAGQITKSFDGSSLSSGVYFYSLIVDGQMVATKKMVLVK